MFTSVKILEGYYLSELPWSRVTSVAEQGALAGAQENRRVYDLWKKGQATQK